MCSSQGRARKLMAYFQCQKLALQQLPSLGGPGLSSRHPPFPVISNTEGLELSMGYYQGGCPDSHLVSFT